MKLKKKYEVLFDGFASIVCAEVVSPNSVVVLTGEGQVFKWSLEIQKGEHLFSIKNSGLDLNAPCSIYITDAIVVVVNDFKLNGIIYNPAIPQKISLYRKDYHADISRYPIALYKDETETPHLIYAVDWNHIQIMNLQTLQILTADKSLIKENAEQHYQEFYEKFTGPRNYLPWPADFDYFFGQLLISPDGKRFLSRGWAWGSFDDFKLFEIDTFITSNRISEQSVFGGEHMNRPVCWINNDTIATTWYPYRDDSATGMSTQIYFIKIGESEPVRRFTFSNSAEVTGDFYFYPEKDVLISVSGDFGTTIIDMNGTTLFKDEDFKPSSFCPDYGLFLDTKDKMIAIYEID